MLSRSLLEHNKHVNHKSQHFTSMMYSHASLRPKEAGEVVWAEQGEVVWAEQGEVVWAEQGGVVWAEQGEVVWAEEGEVVWAEQGGVVWAEQGEIVWAEQGEVIETLEEAKSHLVSLSYQSISSQVFTCASLGTCEKLLKLISNLKP